MFFSLIICTYQRPEAVNKLMLSVSQQVLYPNEVLIVDGSTNNFTKEVFEKANYKNLQYFKVSDKDRGLTKQRNYGVNRVSEACDIICFLDDDTILNLEYFKELIATYEQYPNALGVGGYITNELEWTRCEKDYKPDIKEFVIDGFKTSEGMRFVLRKKLGLDSNVACGFFPQFSHGRSVSFLPPSGNTYQVELLMGGVSSFPKKVFEEQSFSTYFEGYGLYEDADFSLRLSKLGDLFINTKAKLEHYHEEGGRPNKFKYGKMVVVNGWYVWKVKYPNPSFKNKMKWYAITLLLILIRFSNVITSPKRRESFSESIGRISGCFKVIFNAPKVKL